MLTKEMIEKLKQSMREPRNEEAVLLTPSGKVVKNLDEYKEVIKREAGE